MDQNLDSKKFPKHPLAEVFGCKTNNRTSRAKEHREQELCPYNNISPKCTKDKKDAPLGVCSIYAGEDVVIICPVRFREKWIISKDAAEFFFGDEKNILHSKKSG